MRIPGKPLLNLMWLWINSIFIENDYVKWRNDNKYTTKINEIPWIPLEHLFPTLEIGHFTCRRAFWARCTCCFWQMFVRSFRRDVGCCCCCCVVVVAAAFQLCRFMRLLLRRRKAKKDSGITCRIGGGNWEKGRWRGKEREKRVKTTTPFRWSCGFSSFSSTCDAVP